MITSPEKYLFTSECKVGNVDCSYEDDLTKTKRGCQQKFNNKLHFGGFKMFDNAGLLKEILLVAVPCALLMALGIWKLIELIF